MQVGAIGVDPAKSVFQVHGVDERDEVVVSSSGWTADGPP